MGSSTGSLLVEDDDGVAAILRRIARRAAFHAEDETAARANGAHAGSHGDPSSHPDWRDAEAARAVTRAPAPPSPAPPASASMCCMSPRPEEIRASRRHQATSPRSRSTPHHLTFGRARCLSAARHAGPDEPARARCGAPGRPVAGRRQRRRRRARLRPRAAHAARRRRSPIRPRPPACPACRRWCRIMLDHVAAGRLTLERFVDLTSARPGPPLRHCPQGPHRRGL